MQKEKVNKKIHDELGREYTIINGYIPSNYSIWNANLLEVEGKTFLKLYNNDKVIDYSVDINSLLALEVSEELGKTIDKYLAGGRNPKEVKRNLKSERDYIRTRAEKIKPYIERLFNTKIGD